MTGTLFNQIPLGALNCRKVYPYPADLIRPVLAKLSGMNDFYLRTVAVTQLHNHQHYSTNRTMKTRLFLPALFTRLITFFQQFTYRNAYTVQAFFSDRQRHQHLLV